MAILLGMNRKKIFSVSMLICCVLSLIVMLLCYKGQEPRDIVNVALESLDGEIKISWEVSFPVFIDCIEMSVYDANNNCIESISLPAYWREYSFHDGNHGELYLFFLKAKLSDGTYGQEFSGERLYLDYDQLPNLPTISITTVGAVEPTYDVAVKKDELWMGETITNNEYISGSMTFWQNGQDTLTSQVKIRIRGNTTAINDVKKPYKIVLDEPQDLLGLGNEYAEKDWVLLRTGTDLKTYMGAYLANLCDMEWIPRMRFVNVILNNDWKGNYVLIESVKRGKMRCNIDQTGVLFESDAYWWNADGRYFMTSNTPQEAPMGFTFKYPKVESGDDEEVTWLKNYMEEFEDYLYAGDEALWEYIDMDSFISWIMVRDIMGDIDSAGSNIYYYIYAIDETDLSANKLRMGPLWDFDAGFVAAPDSYSSQHGTTAIGGLYFAELFKHDLFVDAYWAKWNAIRDKLIPGMEMALENLYNEQGEALEASRVLDGNRYRLWRTSVESEISDMKEWIHDKADWMNGVLLGTGG